MTLPWSGWLSPVRTALLRQQLERVSKKQCRDANTEKRGIRDQTHNQSPLLCLFSLTPLLSSCPLFPTHPCRVHGAKRNSTLGCRQYVSVLFLQYPRNKSILLGLLMVSSSQDIAALAHTTTNSSSFHYTLHTEPRLLPIRSDPLPLFLTAVQ